MAIQLWPTKNGVAIGDGPIFTATQAQIVIEELSQFSKSSVTLPAADERAVMAMAPYTLLEIVQDGVGTIGSGYVLNPHQQITDRDDDTITLELEPLTWELTKRRTGRGWIAANYLSVIAQRLGALVPNWIGFFMDVGTTKDIAVSVTLNSSILAAFLDVAKQFAQYIRLGVDTNGAPVRTIQMGQFGAAPTVTLVSGNGGDPDAIAAEGTVALVATVDYQPNDVSALDNIVVPFGGGSSSDTLVTLERLWRIINDPTYPNYGKYGSVAGSVFPEYDPLYPIADPVTGTRRVTLDGHFDYPVYDAASYALYGWQEGDFTDSSLTYADNSVGNQELTARALYVSAVANFKRFAHPHQVFTCTAPGLTRPTRAGDLIAVDYQRVSVGDDGAVVEMNVTENLKVMSVVRAFDGDNPPVDTYTLSNLGRFDETDATGQADLAGQMVALQINQGTGLAKDSVTAFGNVDALNPLTLWHYIALEHFCYHQVRVRCDFFPFRGTATTATNIAGTPVVSADVSVELPTPNGLNAAAAAIGAMPEHVHQIDFHSGGNTAPTASTPYVYIDVLAGQIKGNAGASAIFSTRNGFATPVDVTPTNHPHTVAAAGSTVAHIPAGQRLADLPAHVHDVEKRIPTGQPSPAAITLSINGVALSSGAASSGTRNADGSFSSSFIVNDIGPALDAYAPGTDIPLVFAAETSAANPFGVGFLQVTLTAVEELGGLTSTVRAQ